jgi:hypothetical protein
MPRRSVGLFVWSCCLELVGTIVFTPVVVVSAVAHSALDFVWNVKLDWRTLVRGEADPRNKREKLRHLLREWPYLPGEVLLTESFGGGLMIARILERFYWSGGYLLTEVPIARIAEGIAWNDGTHWKPHWKSGIDIDLRCLARLLISDLTGFEKRWVDEHAIRYDTLRRKSAEELAELFSHPDALVGKSDAEIIRLAGQFQNAVDNDRGRTWITWEFGEMECTIEFVSAECSQVSVQPRQVA